jgi:hypothetical protein
MQVKTQLDELQNYLTDASNMAGGHAERITSRPRLTLTLLRSIRLSS